MGGEPGPSSHPRGPPNLGQLANTALQNAPPPGQQPLRTSQEPQSAGGAVANGGAPDSPDGSEKTASASKAAPARRGGRSATMTNEEWTRQRKDNHVRRSATPSM